MFSQNSTPVLCIKQVTAKLNDASSFHTLTLSSIHGLESIITRGGTKHLGCELWLQFYQRYKSGMRRRDTNEFLILERPFPGNVPTTTPFIHYFEQNTLFH